MSVGVISPARRAAADGPGAPAGRPVVTGPGLTGPGLTGPGLTGPGLTGPGLTGAAGARW